MLNIILNILMWFLIAILILVVGFWIYGMITSKEFRDANIESARMAKGERKTKKIFENLFVFILILSFLFIMLNM